MLFTKNVIQVERGTKDDGNSKIKHIQICQFFKFSLFFSFFTSRIIRNKMFIYFHISQINNFHKIILNLSKKNTKQNI